MIELDAATVMIQWAAGGLFFLWVTTRRQEVGLGYGWLQRITFISFAVIALVIAYFTDWVPVRDIATVAMILTSAASLWVSHQRRSAGVAGQRELIEKRSARVAEMTGIDRDEQRFDKDAPEFPPLLDLLPPVFGLIALVAAGIDAADPAWLGVARIVVGALFLGAVSDAMLLGHWYLVQPGLARGPLNELVKWTTVLWPFELLVLLLPTGMWSVLNGDIDDGFAGQLGWFWAASSAATIILLFITRAALKERQYSAVMAATGLLYLAILMAFSMDLVARATLRT
ncbi:MAG: hypothetical protein R8J94_12370 [Acidimicrobiia bacterium]|nr:hypothetical protein [Acidimicrobiia bacterium]